MQSGALDRVGASAVVVRACDRPAAVCSEWPQSADPVWKLSPCAGSPLARSEPGAHHDALKQEGGGVRGAPRAALAHEQARPGRSPPLVRRLLRMLCLSSCPPPHGTQMAGSLMGNDSVERRTHIYSKRGRLARHAAQPPSPPHSRSRCSASAAVGRGSGSDSRHCCMRDSTPAGQSRGATGKLKSLRRLITR